MLTSGDSVTDWRSGRQILAFLLAGGAVSFVAGILVNLFLGMNLGLSVIYFGNLGAQRVNLVVRTAWLFNTCKVFTWPGYFERRPHFSARDQLDALALVGGGRHPHCGRVVVHGRSQEERVQHRPERQPAAPHVCLPRGACTATCHPFWAFSARCTEPPSECSGKRLPGMTIKASLRLGGYTSHSSELERRGGAVGPSCSKVFYKVRNTHVSRYYEPRHV